MLLLRLWRLVVIISDFRERQTERESDDIHSGYEHVTSTNCRQNIEQHCRVNKLSFMLAHTREQMDQKTFAKFVYVGHTNLTTVAVVQGERVCWYCMACVEASKAIVRSSAKATSSTDSQVTQAMSVACVCVHHMGWARMRMSLLVI